MTILRYLDRYLEQIILFLILSLMTVLIGIQVFMRYVMDDSLVWSEELVRWLFVWFIWIGMSYAFKENKHICISVFVDLFSNKIKNIIHIITQVVILVFFIRVIVLSWQQATLPFVINQSSVVLYWPFSDVAISLFWLYFSMIVGCGLSVFRLMQHLVIDIKKII